MRSLFWDVGSAIVFWMWGDLCLGMWRCAFWVWEGDLFDNEGFGGAIAVGDVGGCDPGFLTKKRKKG